MNVKTSQESSDPAEPRRFGLLARPDAIAALVLVLGAIGAAVVFAVVASQRPLSSLEAFLLQAFWVVAGLVGSFVFGRQSAREAAKEMVKPHARSAFRRLLSLYQSLGRLAHAIERGKPATQDNPTESSLDVLEAIVVEQLATANDALEDWRDLIPEDIAELERRIPGRQQPGGKIDQ